MRGADWRQEEPFGDVSRESRVPKNHPLRPIRKIVDQALAGLSSAFDAIHADCGRPSIAPEPLIRALLLQVLYSIRSERRPIEQLDGNLLCRWFVGLSVDAPVWHHATFSKNRGRLFGAAVIGQLFHRVLAEAERKGLTSDEHFSVDGTRIEAWASMKSFRPRDGDGDGSQGGGRNAERDFRGERRTNATHASRTDPDARLYRRGKGEESKLCYLAHALMENRNGLIVDVALMHAEGRAEREAALSMLERLPHAKPVTLGAERGCDTRDGVRACRALRVTPHVAQNGSGRRSALDGRTTRHEGDRISQRVRKRIEEAFGWIKTVGLARKVRVRGLARVASQVLLSFTAYNLVPIRNLLAEAA